MKRMKLFGLAAAISLTVALTACSGGSSASSDVTPMELTTLRTEFTEVDLGGADIEVLNLGKVIEFSYTNGGQELIFSREDGVWYDYFTKTIPMDQEYLDQMSATFFNLKAIEKIENPDLAACGLDAAQKSVYMFDQERGEKTIFIGGQDDNGNYYVRVNEGDVYTVSESVVQSLNFDYETLVVRDSLNVDVTPEQVKLATVKIAGNTKKYDSDDTEEIASVAAGLSNIKPYMYGSLEADEESLNNAELTEKLRTTFYVELDNGEKVESLYIYVGCFADPDALYQYIQLGGSNMIAVVETEYVNQILNMIQE